jgi:hypothetical protein
MTGSTQDNPGGRDAPIRTIIEQNRERGVEPLTRPDVPWGLLGALALMAVGAALIAWWINDRSNRRRPARERAFLRIARRLGLDRDSRALVKDLAAECDIDPLTLLVSPSALHSALASVDRERWRERRGWKQVVSLGIAA